LSAFAGTLGASDQSSALRNANLTFTVFAPSDPAVNSTFDLYEIDTVATSSALRSSFFQRHRITGSVLPSDSLSDGDTFTTAAGNEISVNIDTVNGTPTPFVGGAQVTEADIEGANGIVHVVDSVLFSVDDLLSNQPIQTRLQVTSATQELYDAAIGAEIDTLSGSGLFASPATVFAPSNSALENEDLGSFNSGQIQQILRYHALATEVESGALVQLLADNGGEVKVQTVQGDSLMVTEQSDGTIVFNDGQAALNPDRVDQRASNGIIHLIDGVLLPPSFSSN
jgi:uncharacterized surface protein with fasciclin (FAS1) repeats